MASSILISFAPATVRVRATAAAAEKGGASGGKEEKGFMDWVLGNLTKEDQFYETDPILNKVAGDNGTSTRVGGGGGGGGKNSVAVPPKKNGGFGGLFAKK